MASSASLLKEALFNLYIVVAYLCIKGWLSVVNKVKYAVHYLAACIHNGYGRLTHSALSLIFILLAVPDWILSGLLACFAPLSVAGGATVQLAGMAVLTCSSTPLAPLDPSLAYVDTGCTAFFTNNSSWLAGASPVRMGVTTGNRGSPAVATSVGSSRFRSITSGRVFSFSDIFFSDDMPATLVPLSAMRCAGLTCHLDEEGTLFTFYISTISCKIHRGHG